MNKTYKSLNIDYIKNKISKNKLLKNILYFNKIDSTNLYAENLIKNKNASGGTIIIAEEQTAGKGRKKRKWFSPKFVNFYGTFILRKKIPDKDSFFFTIISALAIKQTIENYHKDNLYIKWPNDILVKSKKIAGTLVQVIDDYVIIGIGININWSPDNSLELAKKATSLCKITKKWINREEFISELIINIEKTYCKYFKNKQSLFTKWKKYLLIPDKEIEIIADNKKFTGRIISINNKGGIVFQTENSKLTLYNIEEY